MPRHARILVPGAPHHVTQRGNYRSPVFFSAADHFTYLRLLQTHAIRTSVAVVAYCLMPNHVHLVLVPECSEGLPRMLGAVHGQYARHANRMRQLTGHCWQGRYFSSPLDEGYFVNAVRYVELNPVRARLVAKAQDYEWSSAGAHCGIGEDAVIGHTSRWPSLAGIVNWSRWLAEGIADASATILRKHGSQNLPCGSDSFVTQIEKAAGRTLRYRRAGREALGKGDSHL
jgi:putative transposase